MRTKHNSKQIGTLRRRRLALALVTAMAAPMALAQNMPNTGNVVSGGATISQNGNDMTITQTTKGAIIDWGGFNIGYGYGVSFDQQFGNTSVTLNRVIGNGYSMSASLINGNMTSNGNVFIINPSGVIFGGSAQVNVGGLVASALWLSDADFNTGLSTGKYVFSGFNGDPSSIRDVRNDGGTINVGAGGVGFVGPQLWNSGAITASGGNIAFGAGDSVTLDYFGDGLTQVTINVAPSIDSSILQNRAGSMTADGGSILLRTAATGNGTGGEISASGLLRAQTIANRNGKVELTSSGGSVMLGARGFLSNSDEQYTAGFIDVSGDNGEAGGSVILRGREVALESGLVFVDPQTILVGSYINASGAGSGGAVSIDSTTGIRMADASVIDVHSSAGNAGSISLMAASGDIYTTNLIASGSANGGSITATAGGDIGIYGITNANGASGNGGRLSFNAGGAFYGSEGMDASGGANGGSVYLSGTSTDTFTPAVDMNGVIDVSGGIGNGGVVHLDGNGAVRFEGDIFASGFANGGEIRLRGTDSAYGGVTAEGLLDASGRTGNGGLIDVYAIGDVAIYGDLRGWGGIDGGTISITGAAVNFQSALAYGSTGHGGSVSVTADDIFIANDSAVIDVQGQTGGGSISLEARNSFVLGENNSLSADTGSSGAGGSIRVYAGNSLVVYGDLSARGVNGGGSIFTGSGGTIDLNGIGIDAGTQTGSAGMWEILAPQMTVLNGSAQGVVNNGPMIAVGTDIQDGDLNNAFATGTNIVLQATNGDVQFDDARILAAFSSPLFLHVNATSAIYGSGFSIGSSGGALEMLFNADSAGGNDNGGYIDFSNTSLSSNGGLIAMYGQSDQAAGFATGYANGISLQGVDLYSAGGEVFLRGHSTGTDAGPDNAGVLLDAISVDSGVGNIAIRGTGMGDTSGVIASNGSVTSNGGTLTVSGAADGLDAAGVYLDKMRLSAGTGDITVDGSSPLGVGVVFANGAGISTTSGAIGLIGEGANFGLDLGDGALDTDTGDITLSGTALSATATAGVRMTGGSLATNGGTVTVTGDSAGGVGVLLGDGGAFAIGSSGGAIAINGKGVTGGVQLTGATLASGGGSIDIEGTASGANATGVSLDGMVVNGGTGNVTINGSAALGSGLSFANGAGISTTSGAITLTGIGNDVGLSLDGGEFTTEDGHIDLRGRGLGASSDGLRIGRGISIATNGGGIELSGEGGSGAGISLGSGSVIDAGNSLVVLRAGNDGSSDAIRLQGAIRSGTGVNLRPGGVDANGALTERTDNAILLGGGTTGLALSAAELAMIDAPELIIGSNLHAGSIQVLGAISREGNLSLQNDGGAGGIDIQAALNVGNGTLALSSGGSITQASGGAITAHSLLAIASGDVLLANAQNNVAATTLAGYAGGAFEFQDVDTLAIGNVSAVGFDASSGGLSSIGANGIQAGGDVFVRNLAGDMILNADVQGADIDLVTAGRLQNPAGARLIASGDWRVWAATWEGETRGGLAGSGDLPNLYGCEFLGTCGVSVTSADNHFIYVQQPTAMITFDNFSREYGLANPTFTFTVTGAVLGDTAANVAGGSAGTTATIASDVGNYAIGGVFTSAAGYRIQVMPGTLAITPATLFFTADSAVRYLGSPNPDFTGTVSGFRNGDTVDSVFGAGGIWSSPAGTFSPVGYYPINGGTSTKNYVFSQAPGNSTALQVIPLPQLSSTPIDLIRETINTYVYDRNFGGAPVCAVNASIDDERIASTGDELSNEWSKVRSRPNLTNCFDTQRKDGCGSF